MNEVQKPQILDTVVSNVRDVLEVGKQNLERHVTAENFCNAVGAIAVISSLAHVKEGNYFRAAGWAGFSLFHLQQRVPGIR